MVNIIEDIKHIKKIRQKAISENKSIGFVATMGNLHVGHAKLLKRARAENDIVILSVFVNPTQFNDAKDYQHYPRTFEHDLHIAHDAEADYIFAPSKQVLYPDNYQYKISEANISKNMEGASRPGHFDGVLTIVMKLLQIVHPTRAYFGEKDYQQLQLINGMVEAFFLDTEIVACTTIRENTGLAFSSRNNLLPKADREKAAEFFHLLSSKKSCSDISKGLAALGFKVDYIEEHQGRRFGAVYIKDVRLIDNVQIL